MIRRRRTLDWDFENAWRSESCSRCNGRHRERQVWSLIHETIDQSVQCSCVHVLKTFTKNVL